MPSRASATIIHLGRGLPRGSSGDLGPGIGVGTPGFRRSSFTLHQVGFTMTADVTAGPVRSYRTVSPLRRVPEETSRSSFCGTFPGVAPGRRYRSPCPVVPGLYLPRLPRRGGHRRWSPRVRGALRAPSLVCGSASSGGLAKLRAFLARAVLPEEHDPLAARTGLERLTALDLDEELRGERHEAALAVSVT